MARLTFRPRLRLGLFPAAIALLGLLGLLGTACGELKSAPPAGNSTTADPTESNGGVPSFGPGAHGSLPSGYCCNDDSECRGRHCAAVGGGAGGAAKMCQDACHEAGTCVRRDLTWKCGGSSAQDERWCEPETPTFTCLPQASFQRGSRQVGECCAWTGDGNSGEECEGNTCLSTGINGDDGPFVCSQRCESTRDCPSSTICGSFRTCEPANFPYTCR